MPEGDMLDLSDHERVEHKSSTIISVLVVASTKVLVQPGF